MNVVLLSDVMEDTDVRMIQTGDSLCFALESLAQFSSVGEMSRKNFDGNDSIETRIAGFINLTHSTRTDRGENFIGP